MLLHYPLFEPSVERLHFGTGSHFGKKVLADLLSLVERRQPRFNGIELQNASTRIELNHAKGELIELGGRYRTMFDMQAERFGSDGASSEDEGVVYDVLV